MEGRLTQAARDPAYWFDVWRRAKRWQREINTALAPWALSHTKYLVLEAAARRGPRRSFKQRELVNATHLTEGAVSQVVGVLEQHGLLERAPHGLVGREWKVWLTSEGWHVLESVRPVVEALAATFPED